MQSFFVALSQRNFHVLDILIDLTQRMVEGELIQLTFNGNHRITEQDLLDIAKRKTAYLFSGCARIGGTLALGLDPVPTEGAVQRSAFATNVTTP